MDIQWELKNNISYVRLIKEFSIQNIREMDETWKELREQGSPVVVFDFSRLEFIDSSAIGTLVKFLNEAKLENFEMIILNVNASIQKIFETAKLSRLFTILTSQEFESTYL